MPSSFEDAFLQVQLLAKDFDANKGHFLSLAYQESEVRKDFIDKMFIALGWDINHDRQKNPFEQEAKVERGVNVQGSQRRADYAFYIAPNFRDVRFYCEAKKPHGDIATVQNYFQTIRYGWNSQTPVALLTDFEQFQILDCRYKPNIDTALNHCIRKFHYSDYADKEKFEFIYYLFSREAVANDSLEKFAAGLPKRRGKVIQRGLFKGGFQNIDDSFLEDLDEYRETLAIGFKNNNSELDAETLTEITQRTVDRLVFIRFLEDKLIHPEKLLENFGDGGTAWHDFIGASRRLDGIYNGIVFKKHEILDSPKFKVNDSDFNDICEKLSPVNSPYDFNTIPIHILGSIYERFLGKVIVTTDKRAHLDLKPELRKAEGVFYTPAYVVNYIVENTIGKLIEGKTPAQIQKMRFIDIACGSGSFLLGVFSLLLEHHGKWFNANPKDAEKEGCVFREDGAWHLSLRQRRGILLRNVYGVDIDSQAVEVAQISLYLKLLDEETTATARQHQLEFHETLLPSLNKNIICGNSLVGTNIESGELLEHDELRKLNPMDFEQRFPEIMKQGGFDAVVGNPPYLNVDDVWGKNDIRLKYLKEHYSDVYNDKTDILFYFLSKALEISKGRIGYIVSRSFLQAYKADKLRSLLLAKGGEMRLVDFQNAEIFLGVGITTCICLFDKGRKGKIIELLKLNSEANPYPLDCPKEAMLERYTLLQVPRLSLGSKPWEFTSSDTRELNEKIDGAGTPLGKVLVLGQGMQTGRNDVFGSKSESEIKFFGLDANSRYQRLRNSDIRRYFLASSEEWLIYVEDFSTFSSLPIQTQNYLTSQRAALQERAAFKRGNCDWWKFTWPLHKAYYNRPRIVCPYLATSNQFALVQDERMLGLTDTTVAFNNGQPEDLKFILALLNSKLLTFRFQSIGKMKGGGVLEYFWNSISKLPIRRINFTKPADKTAHDKIVSLVDQMQATQKQLACAQSDKDKDFYGNKCEALDCQIDALVYELYGLTDEEKKTVQGG